jgi:hypothetical protein
MELAGQNIVVFDLEIKEEIGKNGITWDSHNLMGISVGVLFDFATMDYTVHMDDNINLLVERLNSASVVTGFNINGFDLKLLKADPLVVTPVVPKKVYDMLDESRKAVGQGTFAKGLKLDAHLEGTFGKDDMKTADGAQAPIMWQNKELGRLISYCVRDVKCEGKLFKHIWDHGWVKTPTHGQKTVIKPQTFLGGKDDTTNRGEAVTV